MQLAGQLPEVAEVTFRKVHLHAGRVPFFFLRFRSQFRKVLVQCPGETPEASMRFRNVPVQCPGQVPAGSNAVPMRFPGEVPEGSGGS